MKKIITLVLGVLLVCCLSAAALAAPGYTTSITGETLTVVITDAEGSYGDQITLQILAKDKAIDTETPYTDDKIKSDFVYVNQGYISEEGSYIVNINMEGNTSGNYGVRINGVQMDDIYYATTADKNNFLRQLRTAANGANPEAAVAEKLDLSNPDSVAVGMFMLSDEYITKADDNFIAKVLTAEIKANPACLASADSFVTAITHAAHIAALNDGIGSMEAFASEFELDEDALNVYNTELSQDTRTAFVSTYYKNKKYITNEEVEDAYYDAVILAYAKEFDSYGDAQKLIETFGKDLGVDMDDVEDLDDKTKLYRYVSGLNVSDLNTLVSKINDKASELLKSENSSGSSGSRNNGGVSLGGSTAGIGGGYTPVESTDTASDAPASAFNDMASHTWAIESVNTLYALGIVSGVGDGRFEPGRNVNREEMITMLVRAYGISTDGAPLDAFSDVPADSWFAPYVTSALARGYVAGIGDGKFGAGDTITRQDAAVMAYNIAAANGRTFTTATEKFPDDAGIASYASEAVYALKGAGVINGMDNGSFAPRASCTRAEAAKIICSLINQ